MRRVFSTEVRLSPAGYEVQEKRVLPRNSTCVVCIGTIGKICLTSAPSFTNQQINSVIVDREHCNPLYVYYLLTTAIPKVKKLEGGSASGREHVRKSLFEQIEVEVHPLPTQRKIAAILSAYDDLIENNTRRIAILEEMAQAIYREWFVHFRFPGHEQVAMVDSELGPIPEGWTSGTLGGIGNLRKDRFIADEHRDLPLLDLSRIPKRSLCISEYGKSNELRTSRIVFEEGDVLFGAIRPYLHKVAIAPFRGVTNTSVLVLRNRDTIPKSFLSCFLFSDGTVSWANQYSGGTKMPVIKWDVFSKMNVPIPPSHLLARFDNAMSPMFALIVSLVLRNFRLRRTRDLLLPRLISGEVGVSELEINMGGLD